MLHPRPQSDLRRVQLKPRWPSEKEEVTDAPEHFFKVVRGAFALRRKTLLNSLSASLGGQYTKEEISRAMTACELPENVRGERLSIPQFAQLSRALRGLV